MVERTSTIHPCDTYVKLNSAPSVWCTGCGIGSVVNTFIQAVARLTLAPECVSVVIGNGCTGKIAEYLKFGSHQSVTGSVIGDAMALKQQHPAHTVTVFTSNLDFCLDGIDDLNRAGKKQSQLCVVHINNIIYTRTQHGSFAATPYIRQSEGSPLPFNFPHVAKRAGAHYVARWTSLHVRRLMNSIIIALQRPFLSCIEVISPCLIYNAINEHIGETIERTKFCHDNSIIQSDTPTSALDIRNNEHIVMGVFVNET